MLRNIEVLYFAEFREQRGLARETVSTESETAIDLYRELSEKHDLYFDTENVRAAVNDDLAPWDTPISDGDTVVFLSAFAGG